MQTKVKPGKLTDALEYCISIRQPVCIWGEPGIGKSNIVDQTAKRLKESLIDVRAVLLDPVDLRGLPTVNGEGRAKWAIPDFLPKDGKGILFLDELNRAPMLVQNACFQLILDRKIGEYTLPDGWNIVAACNPGGGGITKMPEALRNRFVHLNVEANLEDWCKWANQNNIEPIVVAFLRYRSELLHKMDAGKTENAFPTPRSWEFVSKITALNIPDTNLELALFEGAVGSGASTEYMSFLKMYKDLPSIDQIILDPRKAPIPDEPATKYAVCSALARRADSKNIARIIDYADRLPDEYAVLLVKDMVHRDKALASTKEFTKWSVDHKEVFS